MSSSRPVWRSSAAPRAARATSPPPATPFAGAEARTEAVSKSVGASWHDPREDGLLPDPYIAMGQTAENLARQWGVTRQDMDEFGVRSQNLAEEAIKKGFWEREITP